MRRMFLNTALIAAALAMPVGAAVASTTPRDGCDSAAPGGTSAAPTGGLPTNPQVLTNQSGATSGGVGVTGTQGDLSASGSPSGFTIQGNGGGGAIDGKVTVSASPSVCLLNKKLH
jgi:hypothetical protein